MGFDFGFAWQTHLIKQMGKIQLLVDPRFKNELHALQLKIYAKKITGPKFWEEYKKILLKSVGKDKKILQELLKKTNKKLTQQFKEAEKQAPKEQKPPIDLSLPE